MTFQHPRAHHFAPPATPWRHSSARGTWLITWLGRSQSTNAQYSSPGERWVRQNAKSETFITISSCGAIFSPWGFYDFWYDFQFLHQCKWGVLLVLWERWSLLLGRRICHDIGSPSGLGIWGVIGSSGAINQRHVSDCQQNASEGYVNLVSSITKMEIFIVFSSDYFKYGATPLFTLSDGYMKICCTACTKW
jgi:hypothetical protein